MSANPILVEILTACRAEGMSPEAAAAALMKDAAPVGMSRMAAPIPEPIEPADLSQALTAVYAAAITAAELAKILHAQFPQSSALDVAQAVFVALPGTSEGVMLAALTGCGFAPTDAQGAVNVVYPASVTIQSTQPWQDTGVTVTGTQSTAIACSGSWTSNPANGACGPNGSPGCIATQSGYTLVDVAEGAMIGRIGSNPPFLVGATATAPAQQAGMLSLCINDDLQGLYGAGLADNSGTMAVTVTTTTSG